MKSLQKYVTKILVAGPVGSGKSTFVQTMSDTPFVETDVLASENIGKLATTVGIDFGALDIDDMRLLLFGVPGQERFDFMWEIACEGVHALVLMVAADRPACFVEARKTLRFLLERVQVPVVVGLTRSDLGEDWDHTEVGAYLGIPRDCVMKLDARDRDSSMRILRVLFEYITPRSTALKAEESLSVA